MSRVPVDIKRGRMEPGELEQIAALAERGLGAGQIAIRLNRHPGTVNYAMHRLGYRKLVRRATAYLRKGVLVKPFSEAEDRLITDLREQGASVCKIADVVTDRFGHRRSPHTVNVRLVMLASASEAA